MEKQAFVRSEDAKKAGQFSRRNLSSEKHQNHHENWVIFRSKEGKRSKAKLMIEERTKRSPQDQLALLDSRLGQGIGATKERTRLQKMIETKK